MAKKKDKKETGDLPTSSILASLIPNGSAPAREITPSATDPALFARVISNKDNDEKSRRTFHRHPFSFELDVSDEELVRLGLIVAGEGPPKNHEYTIDSDEEEAGSSSSAASKKICAASHSALNQKLRKGHKLSKLNESPTTPLATLAEDEDPGTADKTDSLFSDKTLSEKAKGKRKLAYPEDLHKCIFEKFYTAKPRLSPAEYSRVYYVEKAKCDKEGIECPLPPPELYWAWTANYDKFLCVPKIPKTINPTPLVTNLDNSVSGSNGAKYIHTEVPTLRLKESNEKKLRRIASKSDFGLLRLAKLATDSKNKLFHKRTKNKAEEEKPDNGMKPVLPDIDVGDTRLSVGTSLEDMPSIGSVLAASKEQDAQPNKTEAGPSGSAPQNDTDSESDIALLMRGLTDESSSRPKKVLATSNTDESNNATADFHSMSQSIDGPAQENIIHSNDNAIREWTSSVYSSDEEKEPDTGRRVFRVSSDDASSVYSNDESGVNSMAVLRDDNEIPRPISPIPGLFEHTMADTRRENNSPTLGPSNMTMQCHAVSTTGATQVNHPMNEASRNTSFGSIIRQACREDTDAPSQQAYPPVARGRHGFMPLALQLRVKNRHVSKYSGASDGTVVNYSRKVQLRVATEPPFPPPSGPLPPTPDWKPTAARRLPYGSSPPNRAPPPIPAPPAIPLRKRPSLPNEQLEAIGKRAVSDHQARFVAQPEGFASASNFRGEKPFQASSTSPNFKGHDLAPERLRVRKGRNDETHLHSGGQAPRPQLAAASTTQFDTTCTQTGFRGYGNPMGESRIRPSASQAMPLNKENLDQVEQAYQRNQQFCLAFPLGQSLLRTGQNVYETMEDFSGSRYGNVTTQSSMRNGSMITNCPPTPGTFADTKPSIQGNNKNFAPSLYTSAIVKPSAPAGGLSFKTTKAHEEYTKQQMLKDREEVVVASERLREMGSGYFSQRAIYRPKTPKVASTDVSPAPKAREPVRETRLSQVGTPTLVPRPASPTKGFKGKMQKVAEKLKLRKSSKDLREIKRIDTKVSKGSAGSFKSQKGRSTPSVPLARQRSAADLTVSEVDDIPPVPAIPLRHRKTSQQMEDEDMLPAPAIPLRHRKTFQQMEEAKANASK